MLCLLFYFPIPVPEGAVTLDEVTFVNSTHLLLRWSQPRLPNGVLRYQLNVTSTDLVTNVTESLISDTVGAAFSSSILLLVARNFHTQYEVSVVPFTGAGNGVGNSTVLQIPQGGKG